MKKILLITVVATATFGAAFAVNPFSDVTPSDWAYQSVEQLATAGVINGYPDGTFKGQNNITRYEMAQMVAKAMANQSRANAEQQAMINRLADEFSAELNNLGVRVSNLEKKVGNVKVTGDARLKYEGTEKRVDGKRSKFDFRGRIQFNATVNDSTDAVVRVSTDDVEFGDASASKVRFDRMYVAHRFGDSATVTAGRYGETIGAGLMYDDTFDGAKIELGNDKVQFEAGYGYFIDGEVNDGAYNHLVGTHQTTGATTDQNMSFTVLQLKGNLSDKVALGGYYLFGNKNVATALAKDTDIYGFHADFNLTDKVWLGGEWLEATDLDDSSAWVAGIGFGNFDQATKGTWGVKAQYFDEDVNAPVISSAWNQPANADYKGWLATVDYALVKNVGLNLYYGFNGKDQAGEKQDDFYRAELNYQF